MNENALNVDADVDALTGLLGGGVDGGQEGAGAGRVEGADGQEVLRAALQPAHRHRGLVPGDPHLAHGLGFGVVLPVHHLWWDGQDTMTSSPLDRLTLSRSSIDRFEFEFFNQPISILVDIR